MTSKPHINWILKVKQWIVAIWPPTCKLYTHNKIGLAGWSVPNWLTIPSVASYYGSKLCRALHAIKRCNKEQLTLRGPNLSFSLLKLVEYWFIKMKDKKWAKFIGLHIQYKMGGLQYSVHSKTGSFSRKWNSSHVSCWQYRDCQCSIKSGNWQFLKCILSLGFHEIDGFKTTLLNWSKCLFTNIVDICLQSCNVMHTS